MTQEADIVVLRRRKKKKTDDVHDCRSLETSCASEVKHKTAVLEAAAAKRTLEALVASVLLTSVRKLEIPA